MSDVRSLMLDVQSWELKAMGLVAKARPILVREEGAGGVVAILGMDRVYDGCTLIEGPA
jgi:hypothetical protein